MSRSTGTMEKYWLSHVMPPTDAAAARVAARTSLAASRTAAQIASASC